MTIKKELWLAPIIFSFPITLLLNAFGLIEKTVDKSGAFLLGVFVCYVAFLIGMVGFRK